MSSSKSDVVTAVAAASLLCGSLDIVGASLLASMTGRGPVLVLQSIAGAILGRAAYAGGIRTALVGLLLHFAIMTAMTTFYVLIVQRISWPATHPLLGGAIYGVGLYMVMYLVVLPLRWPTLFPTAAIDDIAGQLCCHVFLVGMPMAALIDHLRPSKFPLT